MSTGGPLSIHHKISATTIFIISSVFNVVTSDIWHSRLGHPRNGILSNLRSNALIKCNKAPMNSCHSCPLEKMVKLPFNDSLSFNTMPFDIIHSDLSTSPIVSTSSHKYYILFLDNFSNYLWTFPITRKSQVFKAFLSFRTYVLTQFEREVKTFQSNNGREFDDSSFHSFCEQNGMSFHFSCPHTSPQNGKAERKIKSINNIIRTLLCHASLPSTFWHHALDMATYLLNILRTKVLGYKSPTQILFQKDTTYTHLRVLGCLCYPLFPSTQITKLQARSTTCVFLGYPSNHRGYKCYDISSRKIIVSRHVWFDESQFPFAKLHSPPSTSYEFLGDDLPPLHYHYLNEIANSGTIPVAQPTPATVQPHLAHLGPSTPLSPSAQPPNLSPVVHQLADSPISSSPPYRPPHLRTSPTPPVSPVRYTEPRPRPPPPPAQRMGTRSQHGIHKPNPKYNSHALHATTKSISPIPKNPLSALNDHN